MNISVLDDLKVLKYSIPTNVPPTTIHKYQEVLDKDYAKYLTLLYCCDGQMMVKQLHKLYGLLEKITKKEQIYHTGCSMMIRQLEELGFIKTHKINQYKLIYLRKPAYALVTGNYDTSKRVNLAQSFKNDQVKISLMKAEYLIQYKSFIMSATMFYQLKQITMDILKLIYSTNNKYGYDIECIKKILKADDYSEIKQILDDNPEYFSKLDIIRSIWESLGDLFKKMLWQRQTISSTPHYLKYFVTEQGRVILHYVPKIIMFDVNTLEFYVNRKNVLFNVFYNIKENELRETQKSFFLSNKKSLGHPTVHRIGYTFLLIGFDKNVLEEKKRVLDKDFNSTIYSPLIDLTEICFLDIFDYILHSSQKSNAYSEKHNLAIERIIAFKYKEIVQNEKRTSRKNTKKSIYELLKD